MNTDSKNPRPYRSGKDPAPLTESLLLSMEAVRQMQKHLNAIMPLAKLRLN